MGSAASIPWGSPSFITSRNHPQLLLHSTYSRQAQPTSSSSLHQNLTIEPSQRTGPRYYFWITWQKVRNTYLRLPFLYTTSIKHPHQWIVLFVVLEQCQEPRLTPELGLGSFPDSSLFSVLISLFSVMIGLGLFTCGCVWVPCFIDNTKDVVHKCGNCNTMLGRWHSTGRMEVSQYAAIALKHVPSEEKRGAPNGNEQCSLPIILSNLYSAPKTYGFSTVPDSD